MLHPHVVSQELAEELRKEGWPQEDSEFYWVLSPKTGLWDLWHSASLYAEGAIAGAWKKVSAPLASELMERIENNFDLFYGGRLWYAKEPVGDEQFTDKNVCNALAKLALYLKKEGIMKF